MPEPRRPAATEVPSTSGGSSQPIPQLRSHIDQLDQRICALVRRRTTVAQQIGTIRRSRGGPQIAPGREQEVRRRYAVLGPGGLRLADALLGLGRVPDLSQPDQREVDSR